MFSVKGDIISVISWSQVYTLNNDRVTLAISDIYPPELEFKRTTKSLTELSYLDILIAIVNGKYHTTIFDKRYNFDFRIVTFQYL